jgi:hypothetical protein
VLLYVKGIACFPCFSYSSGVSPIPTPKWRAALAYAAVYVMLLWLMLLLWLIIRYSVMCFIIICMRSVLHHMCRRQLS